MKSRSNKDEDEGRPTATPTTAPDETHHESEEEEDVERLHMYVMIFHSEHILVLAPDFSLYVTYIMCA